MDFSLDTIIGIATLLIGGGGGAFFTWRYQRQKSKAEAEAEKAKFEAMQANAKQIWRTDTPFYDEAGWR